MIGYNPRVQDDFDMYVYMPDGGEPGPSGLPDAFVLSFKMLVTPNNDMATGAMTGQLERYDADPMIRIPLILYHSTAEIATGGIPRGDSRKK